MSDAPPCHAGASHRVWADAKVVRERSQVGAETGTHFAKRLRTGPSWGNLQGVSVGDTGFSRAAPARLQPDPQDVGEGVNPARRRVWKPGATCVNKWVWLVILRRTGPIEQRARSHGSMN